MWRRRLWILGCIVVLAMAVGCNDRPWNSGDRVLVAKYLYETNITPPKRFDVVVFKYPKDPVEKNIPKNYIKRLLGLPGELLAIFFGRLFRWAPDPTQGEAPLYADDKNPEIRPEDLWKYQFMHVRDTSALELFDAGKFEIIRKPPEVMLALRRIVYDNDYQASDLKRFLPPRWQPEAR